MLWNDSVEYIFAFSFSFSRLSVSSAAVTQVPCNHLEHSQEHQEHFFEHHQSPNEQSSQYPHARCLFSQGALFRNLPPPSHLSSASSTSTVTTNLHPAGQTRTAGPSQRPLPPSSTSRSLQIPTNSTANSPGSSRRMLTSSSPTSPP